MYRQTVIPYNRSKYSKASESMLQQVFCDEYRYVSSDGNVWVCKTCDRALMRGKIPIQAKANNLQLSVIPPQLSDLNPMELRLISLRIPFLKMVALPSGKQRCIHGPAVNVPSKVDSICSVLPRLPSQTELVPLKLKRKMAYRKHYMYSFISPEKLLNALRWLKANNPLYSDIDINSDWLGESLRDDKDLFDSLVEPTGASNNDGESELSHGEPSTTVTSGDQLNLPSIQPSLGNSISSAKSTLERVASSNGFVVHDVQYNGDCLFSAVSYQLEPTGECAISSELRRLVADHLENNCGVYCDFVSEPVASDNSYNADTEAPSDDDAYIAAVADPQLQIRLRWERYVQRLRNGAWGDHIALQGIADMLNITVHVLSSQTQAMTHVVPRSGVSQCDVYVGLILQYHYVGLDQVSMDIDTDLGGNSPEDTPPRRTDDPLDDDSIEKGDEHVMQITGGPQASMMSLENPEALEQTVSIAPAEGQKPLAIMTDKDFEAMFNPDKFCFGTGAFSSDRPKKITYQKYFNQRLLDVDGRFAKDLDYLFVAQYIVEAKQVLDDGNNFIWRQRCGNQLTASQAKDKAVLSQCVRKDQAYRFMKNIRGSPPYYQRTFYELLAMIRQLGTPTWFFTLSAADLKWPDMIQTIAKQYGVHYTDEQVMALTFEQKSNWLRRNPVTAARHFQYRLNTFFQDFLKSSAHPLGEIVDYGIRIEFQSRGSPHAHTVIWIKDAPKYGVNDDSEVCDFIDRYISCDIPKEEGKLKELVLLLQQHKHASYCKRHNKCRFNFPHPPSPRTLIAKPNCDKEVIDKAQTVLSKVRGVIGDGQISLENVLEQAEVTNSEYMENLQVSGKGNVVVLKREPSECYINNYNGPVMLAWQANMDLQYVLNAYACVMYVASYIMKTDRSMGELLKRVTAEARTEDLRTQLKKVGSAF